MAEIQHNLTDEHRRALDSVLESCPRIMEVCEVLGSCGIDMEERKAVCQEQAKMARALKAKLFPNYP